MSALVDRATQAFNAGDWSAAKALCFDALKTNANDPDALLVLGHIQASCGETAAAEASLSRARSLGPADRVFLADLAAAYTLAGLETEARAALEAALRIDPEFPRALCGLGDVLYQQGKWDEARALYERALARRADFPRAIAALAELALRQNRDEDAKALADKAAALAPALPAAQLTLAELALARGAADEALAAAERVLGAWQANPQHRGLALEIKARSLERLGRFDDAFAAFEQSNTNLRVLYARFDAHAHPLSAHRLSGLLEFVRAADLVSWPKPPPDARPAPVFLLGFARSGTTLIGQVLGAHPDVETMEENDSFEDAVHALLGADPITPWDRLAPEDVAPLRAAYWRRVRERLGRMPSAPVVVDKMPMNVILLPVIHLLFPGAKIVFAVRDPRDVVMSCFKQRFALNYATANFLTLEGAARYYEAVMQLAAEARRRLPLNIHDLRYERVVSDFDAAIGETLSFMDLPWSDDVRLFSKTTKAARILTPSARAVAQPISQAASGAWLKYAERLAPHRPVLDEWASSFGYE